MSELILRSRLVSLTVDAGIDNPYHNFRLVFESKIEDATEKEEIENKVQLTLSSLADPHEDPYIELTMQYLAAIDSLTSALQERKKACVN